MNKKDLWIIIFVALAVGGFIWALDEKNKRLVAEFKAKQLKIDYLELLSKYLQKQEGIPEEIKQQLFHLRKQFIGIQDEVAVELKNVIDLINIGKEEIAIEKLSKIIENVLKDEYVKNGLAKDKTCCPKLFEMLNKALELKWINKHEYHFSMLIKDVRNTEAHELAVNIPINWKFIAFLAGIEILYKLRGFKRKRKQQSAQSLQIDNKN